MGTILLSGASGFIARNAAEKLKKAGFRTIGLSHNFQRLPHFDAVYPGTLSQPLIDVFGENIDVFVHCAYHSGKDDYTVNVEGTRLWADQAEKEGVRHQIFLSSVSARAESASSYSRAKHTLEQWFLARNFTVMRLGLVVGKGGLFQRMVSLVKKFPLLPILDGGRARVYVSGIRDVCEALGLAVEPVSWIPGNVWNIFQAEPFYLKEILVEIRKRLRTGCLFFSVPGGLALALLRVLEKIPFLKLRISSNNIIGLKQGVREDWGSDYSRFGLTEETLEHLITNAL
jgi:nucleoside-diphosphate-sugar epimerase